MKELFNRLFIFEMANNHMGSVEHGLHIVQELHRVSRDYPFQFAVKFQYRDLDTFIHPQHKKMSDAKYVKRFLETNLTPSQRKSLKDEAEKLGFISICTPFDERSVDLIEEQGYQIIKVASCSFTDWPLLERISRTKAPVIASTAGASLEDIDNVVQFLQHRDKEFCLMHCVGEYPTAIANLQLGQIDVLKQRYPEVPVGYSTHEAPATLGAVQMAIAKGATVFERHVGVKTHTYDLNPYSSSPDQIAAWLSQARDAFDMCGISGQRFTGSDKEKADLRGLQRGVFARIRIAAGQKVDPSNSFLAIPNSSGQIVANDLSKYTEFIAAQDIESEQPVLRTDVTVSNLRDQVLKIIVMISEMLKKSNISLPNKLEMEISHHYGVDRFREWGAAIINCVNREYCKKLIILLPGQQHPMHFHKKKEETFHVLYGDLKVGLADGERSCKAGDFVLVERGMKHNFSSQTGAIFEEISTTHFRDDSFYDDASIMQNPNRKTAMTFWSDWLLKPII